MTTRKSWLLTIIFLAVFGFTLGVICLFELNVPLEGILKQHRVSQLLINIAMSGIILFWAATVIIATVMFHRKLALSPERYKIAIGMILLLGILAGGFFTLLVFTNNDLVATFKGSQLRKDDKFMIGPYPEEERLQLLKKEGCQGVISLLSPTIPFEKILLDREIQAGEKIGLQMYSFPMLPWISGNENSLRGIKELVEKEKGPFYIHCYLGKHRADLVISTLTGENRTYLNPDRLENGRLYYYQDGRIILGPFPNDEEWFHLVKRGQVKEVISFLDPDNSEEARLIEKEKDICAECGVELKLLPVRLQGNQVSGLTALLDQVGTTDNKVFIHGFKSDVRFKLLDASLRSGIAASTGQVFPEQFGGGKIYSVHPNLVLGPEPNDVENGFLQTSGFTRVTISMENNLSPPATCSSILSQLGKNGTFYVSGFKSEKELELIKKVLLARFYGIDSIDMKISSQSVTKMGRYLFVGLRPDQEELKALAMLGINTILYPQKATAKPDQSWGEAQKLVEEQGLKFQTVQYEPGNVSEIIAIANRDNNPCYLVAGSRERAEMAQDIDAAKLIN